jgi:hypothetical protein
MSLIKQKILVVPLTKGDGNSRGDEGGNEAADFIFSSIKPAYLGDF